MGAWLYQLSQIKWPTGYFRQEIWEGKGWNWGYGNKRSNTAPGVGDILIFYYARSGGTDFGFFGWAVVDRHDADNYTLYFTPSAPTNYLKMDPWSDAAAERLADKIRGRMTQATLFPVDLDHLREVRKGIKAWLAPAPLPANKSKP